MLFAKRLNFSAV